MKRITVTFVLLVLATLMIFPSVNLAWRGFENSEQRRWWDKSSLYSFDIIRPAVSCFLYPFGISIRPEQVVVGKNGWLSLGDLYAKTISLRRFGPGSEEMQRIRQVSAAAEQWRGWAARYGVKVFKFMVAPDKETVYPEYLPEWARPGRIPFWIS